jgi:hypothetical protein
MTTSIQLSCLITQTNSDLSSIFINIQVLSEFFYSFILDRQFHLSAMQMVSDELDEPNIEQGKELAGLYVFHINKPFTITAKTNYLLPMFRAHVAVERYAFISKIFLPVSITGKAQRSYRLKSDRYLSEEKYVALFPFLYLFFFLQFIRCIIREDDRIVGETALNRIYWQSLFEIVHRSHIKSKYS